MKTWILPVGSAVWRRREREVRRRWTMFTTTKEVRYTTEELEPCAEKMPSGIAIYTVAIPETDGYTAIRFSESNLQLEKTPDETHEYYCGFGDTTEECICGALRRNGK